MNEFDDPRFDSSGNPIAVGNTEQTVYAVDSSGDTILTDGTWQEIYLPEGVAMKRAILQVHDGVDTNFEIDSYNSAFLFRQNSTSAFIRVPYVGRTFNIALEEGQKIGEIKAEVSDYYVSVQVLF